MSTRRQTPVHVETVVPADCSVDLRLSILRQVPFFASLSAEEICEVNEQFREYGFQPDETICFSGDPATTLYIVAAGQVRLLRHSANGQDVLLDILKPGEHFGSLMPTATGVYLETAQAQTATCALTISTAGFRSLLQKHASVAVAVLDITSTRLHESQEIIRQLSTQPVEQRLAAVLLKLADKLGDPNQVGLLIQMPLSREDLAKMAGSSAETVSRIMSQFQKAGLIQSGRQWVAVSDRARLEQIAKE